MLCMQFQTQFKTLLNAVRKKADHWHIILTFSQPWTRIKCCLDFQHILKTIGYDNETSDLATNVTTACNLFESSDLLVTHQMR